MTDKAHLRACIARSFMRLHHRARSILALAPANDNGSAPMGAA